MLTFKKKYALHEDYFDIIDGEEKAYFLGFLFADGCNKIKDSHVVLSISEKDKDTLEKLNKLIYPNKKLGYIKPRKGMIKKNGKIRNDNALYTLIIYSKKICHRLLELGIMSNKIYKIRFPEWLDGNLIRHFIRGYYDGNGSIIKYLPQDCITHQYGVSISSNKYFLRGIQKYLQVNTSIRKNRNIYDLRIMSNRQVKEFCEFIYKDATIYLSRKFDKYQQLLQDIKQVQNKKSSKYKFISYHKQLKKWQIIYQENKKIIRLGMYNTEEEAYQALPDHKKLPPIKEHNNIDEH